MGVGSGLTSWITDFLSDRTFRVKVGECLSREVRVTSGCPQGTVLGALSLVPYFDAVKNIFPAEVSFKIYADDLKLYAPMRCPEDRVTLQTAANEFANWTSRMGLEISTHKCCVFHCGPRSPRHPYTLNGALLEPRNEIRDLGVLITEELDFSSHVTSVLKKTARLTNWILRAFAIKKPDPYLKMYSTTVKPIIMYASPAWYPRYQKDLKRLQQAQDRFIRRLKQKTDSSEISMRPIVDQLNEADQRFLARLKRAPARFEKLFDQTRSNTRAGGVTRPKATARTERIRNLFPWRVTNRYAEM